MEMDFSCTATQKSELSPKTRIIQNAYITQNTFIKKFPKHFNKLNVIPERNTKGLFFSKLKRTKIIRQVDRSFLDPRYRFGKIPSKYLPLVLFQNKLKTINKLHHISPDTSHYFPSLSS